MATGANSGKAALLQGLFVAVLRCSIVGAAPALVRGKPGTHSFCISLSGTCNNTLIRPGHTKPDFVCDSYSHSQSLTTVFSDDGFTSETAQVVGDPIHLHTNTTHKLSAENDHVTTGSFGTLLGKSKVHFSSFNEFFPPRPERDTGIFVTAYNVTGGTGFYQNAFGTVTRTGIFTGPDDAPVFEINSHLCMVLWFPSAGHTVIA